MVKQINILHHGFSINTYPDLQDIGALLVIEVLVELFILKKFDPILLLMYRMNLKHQ